MRLIKKFYTYFIRFLPLILLILLCLLNKIIFNKWPAFKNCFCGMGTYLLGLNQIISCDTSSDEYSEERDFKIITISLALIFLGMYLYYWSLSIYGNVDNLDVGELFWGVAGLFIIGILLRKKFSKSKK